MMLVEVRQDEAEATDALAYVRASQGGESYLCKPAGLRSPVDTDEENEIMTCTRR